MRIIAGRLRGKKLKAPKGLTTRPVLARVREALFNVLGDMDGIRVLDIYAGTGSIGIEALSRGAQSAVFVDLGHTQCCVIRENLKSIGKDAIVIQSDAEEALQKLQSQSRVFDFVFVDPPYEKGLSRNTVLSICERELLSESGILGVTIRYLEEPPLETCQCKMIFNRRYGDTRLVLYKMKSIQRSESQLSE